MVGRSRTPVRILVSRVAVAGSLALAALFAAQPAAASAASTDNSDLWWNAAESGWGLQLVQQHDTIFATMYVYGVSNQPEFYIAVLDRAPDLSTWTGSAFRTTGPWWGGPFDPAQVVETPVGTLSFRPLSVNSGRLDYTINQTTVTKFLLRMSFANDRIAGSYVGAAKFTVNSGGCEPSGPVASTASFGATAGVASSATLTVAGRLCSMPALEYLQQGQYARMTGAYACDNGEAGTATYSRVKVGTEMIAFDFRLVGAGPGYACQIDGNFAGVSQ